MALIKDLATLIGHILPINHKAQGIKYTPTAPLTADNVQEALDSLAASGDVTGPASSTDEALARFNGTTGKVIQNSTVVTNDIGVTKSPFLIINDTITSSESVTIPSGKQMIVGGPYNIDGSLDIEGTFWVL